MVLDSWVDGVRAVRLFWSLSSSFTFVNVVNMSYLLLLRELQKCSKPEASHYIHGKESMEISVII